MTLTKSDIIENLAKSGLTRKKSGEMLENLLEIIKKSLENGKGKRRGRNPATGSDLMLNERRVVTFSCSPVLREKIN